MLSFDEIKNDIGLSAWPKRVIDDEGDEFHHQGNGIYRMFFPIPGHLGEQTYALGEIGIYAVIEA